MKVKVFICKVDEDLEARINDEIAKLQLVRHDIVNVQVMPKATELRVIILFKYWG